MNQTERIALAKEHLNKALEQYDGTISYMRKYLAALTGFPEYVKAQHLFPELPNNYEEFRALRNDESLPSLLEWNYRKGWAMNQAFLARRIETLEASRSVIEDAMNYLLGMDPEDPLLGLPGFYVDILEALQIGLSEEELYAFLK